MKVSATPSVGGQSASGTKRALSGGSGTSGAAKRQMATRSGITCESRERRFSAVAAALTLDARTRQSTRNPTHIARNSDENSQR
jgi:hypothetical protein